ncbi:MAG: ATP-binding cassette domain-containing protein, partial [Caulobacteraceae bacterium]
AAPELQCFDLTPRAIDALMVHDSELGHAALGRSDAEALMAVAQAAVVGATLTGVALAASHAPLPLAALAVLAGLAGMDGLAGLLRADQQQGAYRAAVERLDSLLVADAGEAPPLPLGSPIEIRGHRLAPGARLGVSGPSGGGKTTLIEALVGLRTAAPGAIRIADTALESAPIGWARPLFAYAPQDARLLTGSIADNLRLASPEDEDAALWDALADAQLDARVRRLPQGLQTWIGDGGEVLSGGERRRLSLARAFLRPAPWLVLDEPTEGLDRETEEELVAALDRRLKRTGQGLILVSHRPQPLALCADILTLEPQFQDLQAT